MNMENNNPEVVVVGAGLTGLAAAAFVAKAGRTVAVREARGRVGGQATTDVKDGYFFNQGPHALYVGGAAESALDELGVKISAGKPAGESKVAFDGRAHTGPAGLLTLLRTRALSVKDKLEVAKFLGALPKLDATELAESTVDHWLDAALDRTRPRQLLEGVVRLTCYGAQTDQLSADVAVSQIQSGLSTGVKYLDRGWQQLIDQLSAMVQVQADDRTDELPDAPAVIVAVGSPRATSKLVGTEFEVGPPANVSCLDLGLNRRPDIDVLLGADVPFYFSNYSAVADLAPPGCFHAVAAQYLRVDDQPDADAIREFARLAGVQDADIDVQRKLHRMTAVTAIPSAHLGGLAGRPAVDDTGHAGVFMAGDWIGPEGHLGDACFASARAAAVAALAWVDK